MKKQEVLWRVLMPIQAKGDVGKSTELMAAASWLDKKGVVWRGFDLDDHNQTFSRVFPEKVSLVTLGRELEDDIIGVFKQTGKAPITLIDPRAHQSQDLLRTMEMIRFTEMAAEKQGRITALLFVQDNLEIMQDIDATTERLGGSVDYLIVNNAFKAHRTKMFDGSQLQADLRAMGAVEITMPVLLSSARNQIAKAEVQAGRGVSLAEASENKELAVDYTARLVIEDWLGAVYRQHDRVARVLLPTAELSRIQPENGSQPARLAPARGRKVNLENL
jgi:hypothetical protein